MPESIDWPPTPAARPRRRRRLVLILAVLAVIFFGGRSALSNYVDLLWFRSLGYGGVFWKTLSLQWGVFAAFAAHIGDSTLRGRELWVAMTSRPDLLSIDMKRQGRFGLCMPLFPAQGPEDVAELFSTVARVKNVAKVEANGTLPRVLKPTATATMFCSAMKHSVERSGNFLKNLSANVEFFVSPSTATMR